MFSKVFQSLAIAKTQTSLAASKSKRAYTPLNKGHVSKSERNKYSTKILNSNSFCRKKESGINRAQILQPLTASATQSPGTDEDFEQRMMLWDETFEQVIQNEDLVESITFAAKKGLECYGHGIVLVTATLEPPPQEEPPVDPNSFQAKMQKSLDQNEKEGPQTITMDFEFGYVPYTTLRGLPDRTADPSHQDDFNLVGLERLSPLMQQGAEVVRLCQLCTPPGTAAAQAPIQGLEDPYRPEHDELVIILDLEIQGTHTVGADPMVVQDGKLLVKGLEEYDENEDTEEVVDV